MRAQTTYLFATRADLEPGLRSIERERPLKYVLGGLFVTPTIAPIYSALEIPDLGVARRGDQAQENRYFVVDAATKVEARPVPQRRGGVLYAVDHVANPTAIIFRPGGLFEERCLIGGEIVGLGSPGSLALYRPFSRSVVAGFVRIKSFYVGPEATRLLDSGARLTQSVRAPATCDLRPDGLPDRLPGAPAGTLRLGLADTWDRLEALGFGVPRRADRRPLIPDRMPGPDDLEPGLAFLRTALGDETLENLTMPRTYFRRSEFRRVSFRNTDLTESRMCWNDWLECDFTEADLTGSDMRGSLYTGCRFGGAVLTDADLRRSTFVSCEFAEARMLRSKLTHKQGAALALTALQRDAIDWRTEDGPEPPGG